MTTHFATRLMPAGINQKFNPNEDKKEVNTVAIFESRQAAKKRVWDRSSAADMAARLESARLLRQMQLEKAAQQAALYALRINR